jgi:hypothetical protein
VLECGNDTIFIVRRKYLARIVDIVNEDRKVRPVTKIRPDRCPMRAEKIEIEISR